MQDLRFRHLHGRVQVSIQTGSSHSLLDFPKNTPPPTGWTLNITRARAIRNTYGRLPRHGHLANMGTTTPPRRLLSGSPGCHRFWADDMTGCFLISCCLGRLRWHQFWSPRRSHGLTCRTYARLALRYFYIVMEYGAAGARLIGTHTHTDTLIHPRSPQSQHSAHVFVFPFPTGPKPAPHPPISQALPFPSLPFPSHRSPPPPPPSAPENHPSTPPHSQELRTLPSQASQLPIYTCLIETPPIHPRHAARLGFQLGKSRPSPLSPGRIVPELARLSSHPIPPTPLPLNANVSPRICVRQVRHSRLGRAAAVP